MLGWWTLIALIMLVEFQLQKCFIRPVIHQKNGEMKTMCGKRWERNSVKRNWMPGEHWYNAFERIFEIRINYFPFHSIGTLHFAIGHTSTFIYKLKWKHFNPNGLCTCIAKRESENTLKWKYRSKYDIEI